MQNIMVLASRPLVPYEMVIGRDRLPNDPDVPQSQGLPARPSQRANVNIFAIGPLSFALSRVTYEIIQPDIEPR